MPVIALTSLEDPRLAVYRHLKTSNAGRDARAFVVEGAKLVDRLLSSPFTVLSALADTNHCGMIEPRLSPDVPLFVLPRPALRELIGYEFHQGVLASGRRGTFQNFDTLMADPRPRRTIVVCPSLNNPENLGTILRLADVFDVEAVLVGPSCPDPFSRRVLRVSMGFALWRSVFVLDDLIGACERLRARAGFAILGAVATSGAEPFDARPRPDRSLLVLGHEATGIDGAWIKACDRAITVPMRPGAESLNVAVATGVLLHHFQRDDTWS